MKTIPEALKDLYVAMGGTAADVANLTLTPDVINAIAEIAGGVGKDVAMFDYAEKDETNFADRIIEAIESGKAVFIADDSSIYSLSYRDDNTMIFTSAVVRDEGLACTCVSIRYDGLTWSQPKTDLYPFEAEKGEKSASSLVVKIDHNTRELFVDPQ